MVNFPLHATNLAPELFARGVSPRVTAALIIHHGLAAAGAHESMELFQDHYGQPVLDAHSRELNFCVTTVMRCEERLYEMGGPL